MIYNKLPSLKFLETYLYYDGYDIFWKKTLSNRVKVGDPAGSIVRGYIVVRIKNKKYFGHRIIWKMIHGKEPSDQIDHKNGDTL